ncbi:MAG TPA: LysR substrate-binding domain-containing protein [Rubricoccaceae bacterium]|nr:LysR substrate-binding domain-containing protein [Rubricoccaceae bacterium]
MTLLQLTYAVALERHGHFGLAAEACHVTQPTLSTQVRKLEDELGVVLFDRTAHPIVPTEVGRQVVAQARLVLAEVERLRELVREATGEMAGELRVGLLSTMAPYLLPLVIAPFARRYPRVALVFEELVAERIVEHVRRDLLDAGLVATPVAARGLVEVPLFEEPLVGYVAPGHRLYDRETIAVEDLSAEDVWVMREGHCFREQALQLLERGAAARPDAKAVQFESGNLETLQRLVDRGYGMTLLPWLAVQGEGSHAPESVRPFRDPAPTRTVRLVYAATLLKRHLVRAFAAEVVRAVAPVLPPGAVVYEPDA